MMLRLQRLWLQLTADRRRFGILCAMCLVGLLLWARIIIIARLPRTAVADDQAIAHQTHGGSDFSDSDNSTEVGNRTATATSEPREPISVALWQRPQRDPFLIPQAYYPRPTPIAPLNGEAGKSGPKQADTPERAEARLVERLRAQVQQMSLQAVMTGSPMAVIDGRMYQPGSRVPAPSDEQIRFLLVDVQERSVILEFEGRQFTLVVPLPGEA